MTSLYFQQKERTWTPLCAQVTHRTQFLEAAMSYQVLLNHWILSLWLFLSQEPPQHITSKLSVAHRAPFLNHYHKLLVFCNKCAKNVPS